MAALAFATASKAISDKYKLVQKTLGKYNAIIIVCSMLLYRIILDLNYKFAVYPLYGYRGLNLAPNGIKYIYSWVLYIVIILLIPKVENRISSFFLHFQLLLSVVPLLTVYAMGDKSSLYITMVAISLLLQVFILGKKRKSMINVRLANLSSYTTVFFFAFIIISFFMALAWGGFFGLDAFNLEFLYKIRETALFPGFMNYTLNWCHSLFIPFFMVYALNQRKYLASLVLFLIQLCFFMILGHKIILLRLVVLIACYIITKLKMPVKLLYFALISMMFIILIITTVEIKNSKLVIYANSFISHRALFYPAQLKNYYFDFFNEYPKLFFSEGQIGKIFNLQYPFSGKVGQTISSYMYSGNFFKENAVTGYLGESYGQLGVIGMFLMSFIIATYIKCIEYFSDKKIFSVFVAMIGLVVLSLNDTSVLTLLLFGGYLFLFLFAVIYVGKDNKSYNRRELWER